MAKLYRTEYNEIVQRRSGQDINTLIMLLETDGSIEIADDPTEDEILAAREQAAKDAEKQQAEAVKEQEQADKEAEKEREEQAKAAETARVAALPHPDDSQAGDMLAEPPEGSEVADEQAAKEKEESKSSSAQSKSGSTPRSK